VMSKTVIIVYFLAEPLRPLCVTSGFRTIQFEKHCSRGRSVLVDSIRLVVTPDKHVATDRDGKKSVFPALAGRKL
jgi:hypothetical protein